MQYPHSAASCSQNASCNGLNTPSRASPSTVAAHGEAIGVATETPVDRQQALQHVDVIANEIRRLDQAVQGFLKFTRPEDLTLQPVNLAALFKEVIPIVQPEADRARVALSVDADHVPDVNGDPAMLRQAFLNLALNACQAMPNGGALRIRAEPSAKVDRMLAAVAPRKLAGARASRRSSGSSPGGNRSTMRRPVYPRSMIVPVPSPPGNYGHRKRLGDR